ncbi:AraC family transcriptional regulator [Pseudomonas sp. N040]|uniref:AraC family transcriptional regulator n=1 Tax=Pseudomonas sp. N040 TaxID=2785325 RepID=UPI0018A2F280|nr:AraC family transcriptional regulator [Pseudomonas sp. N040]MBF7731181.1 AraC family transcriptional regulator ligand-binding domain-containing protein [Pseudomonas sp. N040]MBW7014824.1 AraC family transcriptional regulator ligand-binding domain-containing protein [Pseudomonas sp. N040]
MTQMTRSAALTGFATLVSTYGLDPLALAREAKVPLRALHEPDLKVAAANIAKLVDLAAARADADDFGLRLAETRRISNMGPIALLATMQPTLREMLRVFCKFQRLNVEPLTLALEESRGVTVLRVELTVSHWQTSRHLVELIVGGLSHYLGLAVGSDWRPKAVHFRHAEPTDTALHRRVFHCMPVFKSDFNGLVIDSRDLDISFPASDPVFVSYIQAYIDNLARSAKQSTCDEVKEIISILLASGRCNADTVAASMGIDRRTLHRRLAAENIQFRDLLEERRKELVIDYLDGKRAASDVAELVGLASANGLSHWVKRHFSKPLRQLAQSERPEENTDIE